MAGRTPIGLPAPTPNAGHRRPGGPVHARGRGNASPRTPPDSDRISQPRTANSPVGGRLHLLLGLAVTLALALPGFAQTGPTTVIVNELMYHPPDDRDELQFVELLNQGATTVDLAGWKFTKGIQGTLPAGAVLPPGTYGIVCKDVTAFRAHYGARGLVLGTFQGRLSHGDERLELSDSTGRVIDTLHYHDAAPWPAGPDGFGPSLERICPTAPADAPWNWAASRIPLTQTAAGSPGATNTCFAPTPPPRIEQVTAPAATANQPLTVSIHAAATDGVQVVTLHWWSLVPGHFTNAGVVAAQRTAGDATEGTYAAVLPAQPAGRIVRYAVCVTNRMGIGACAPGGDEPRPTYTTSTLSNTNRAAVAALSVLAAGRIEPASGSRFGVARGRPGPPASPARGSATVVYFEPDPGGVRVFDYVRVRRRSGGLKIHFHKDQLLDDMSGINLLFEQSPRYLLTEHLGFQLFRRAGVVTPQSDHVRLFVDGRAAGYHLLVEQPNRQFLRRNGRDEDGNLYKILWYEQGVVRQHEKKTNPATGHADIVDLVNQLNRSSGPAQWRLIQQQFNVDAMASLYAVNMCIQNWDGFFNNHYVYHDLKPGGKWEVFPWDLDKTWGDYDGASARYDWYTMPLTTGMNGDRQSGWGGGDFSGWWRPPGWFSGPLLANPEFRRLFLTRLRQVCDEWFTPDRMEPAIQALQNRLEPEVRFRSQITGENPDQAVRQFQADLQSLRNQVLHRRQFILKNLPPP